MEEETRDNLKLVNAAGYLFQLKVIEHIKGISAKWENKILASEHRWIDEDVGDSGFIDFVLEIGSNGRMVAECKRVRGNGKWIFLVPSGEFAEGGLSRLLWTGFSDTGRAMAAWDLFQVRPQSLTSSFCIVRGGGEKDPPYLELQSRRLIRATECLAEEELGYRGGTGTRDLRLYFPAIITNAELLVCKYDPAKIDLETGELPEGKFESVPFIRFTKTLPSNFQSSFPQDHLYFATAESERTVYVFNARSLQDSLRQEWEFGAPSMLRGWPWLSKRWTQGEEE